MWGWPFSFWAGKEETMNVTTRVVQLPPADLQAQDRAWKGYLRKKYRSMKIKPDVIRIQEPA